MGRRSSAMVSFTRIMYWVRSSRTVCPMPASAIHRHPVLTAAAEESTQHALRPEEQRLRHPAGRHPRYLLGEEVV